MNESIISKKELNYILEFVNVNEDLFVKNTISSNRKYLTLYRNLNPPSLFFEIKKRILDREKIIDNYIDDVFSYGDLYGDYIGFISDGGKIHYHKDQTLQKYKLIRFNLFLSVPEKGGLPIYNGVTIPVNVGDYIRCNSSEEHHECEMVEGDIPRIIISYGIYLKQKNKLINYS